MPEVVGAAIFAAIGAAAAGEAIVIGTLTVATLVGSIVTTGVLIGAELLLAPKPDIPKPQEGKIALKQPLSPPIWGYGECPIAGAYVAYDMVGSTSYDVIAIHQGHIDSYVKFYLNEDLIKFFVGNDGTLYDEIHAGRYAGNGLNEMDVELYWRLGEATETAYPKFIAANPDLWTAAHRGDGVASINLITFTPNDKAFSRRLPFSLPKPVAVGRWQKCWDFRDPAQHENTSATWVWTRNPILQLLHFYCHCPAGFRRPVANVYTPVSSYWVAAADRCDEVMTRADSTTEPRYASDGHLTAETPRKSVIEALLRTCDGWVSERGDGAIVVYAGAYYEPTIEINDAHVLDSDIKRGRLENERINQILLKVPSREHDYNDVEPDPWVDQAAIDAGAIIVSKDAETEWVTSWSQARRLGKIEFDKQTCDLRGTLILNLFGENLKGRRYFTLNLRSRQSTRMIPCEVINLTDDSFNSGTFQCDFQSVRPDRYDWDAVTEEGKPPANPDKSDQNDDFPTPNQPTLAIVRQNIAGGGVISVISATNPPVEGYRDLTLDGRYRRTGGSDTDWQIMSAPDTDLQVFSGAVTDGSFEVQTRYVGGGGGRGDYSPTATINVVSDPVPPSAPVEGQTIVTGLTVEVSFRTSNSTNGATITFYRGEAWMAFSDATNIGTRNIAGPNVVVPINDTPGAGEWKWWATEANGSLIGSAASAPTPVTGIGTKQFVTVGGDYVTVGGQQVTVTS